MKLLNRLWQNRWVRRSIWTLTTVFTLYVLLCSWLNWHWGRRWVATVEMLKAEGETLDFRAIVKDPIPEDDNFCAIPLLKEFSSDPKVKGKRLEAVRLPGAPDDKSRPKVKNAAFGEATDLAAWADWLRKEGSLEMPADSGNAAGDLVAGLSKHDAVLGELGAGLNRTQGQWLPEWKTRPLPEPLAQLEFSRYGPLLQLCEALALRAAAAARAGNPAQAHESILISLRLAQANLNEPFVIGQLLAARDALLSCGSIWEMCDTHSGKAEDFSRLESALSAFDFHQGMLRGCRGEMAVGVNTLQYFGRGPAGLNSLLVGEDSPDSIWRSLTMRMIPNRYCDASVSVVVDLRFNYTIKPFRDQDWNGMRKASQECEKILTERRANIWTNPTYIMAGLSVPSLGAQMNRIRYSQVLVNQAIIACALERHRIENGSYPESLDSLKLASGKPLPLDINQKPMGYRATPEGKYALWSVGFDGRDDGGKRALNDKEPSRTAFYSEKYVGDWVWDYAGAKGNMGK